MSISNRNILPLLPADAAPPATPVFTPVSLIESLLRDDRPAAWWGLDTVDPLVDDSGHGFTLTALATPTDAVSLHTRGDTGDSGCRDFNGTTGGYFTNGTVTDVPAGPPAFHDGTSAGLASTTFATVVSPGGIQVGDLMIYVTTHPTAGATITTGPTGFTQVGTTLNAGTHAIAVYRKTAVQADTVPQDITAVWSAAAVLAVGVLVYRGCDTSVANLIFDSGQQVTASDTFHSTTTETFPNGARQLVIWSQGASAVIPNSTNVNERINLVFGGFGFQAVDYEQETAGTGFTTATSSAATTLGAIHITFGAPNEVLDNGLDAIAATMTIGCLVNLDTVAAGTRTIIRKHQSWGLHVVAAVLTFVYTDGGGTDRSVSGPSLSINTTYRLWVKDDGTNIHFFVNGTKTSAARVGAAGYTVNANRVSIAHYYNGSTTSNFLDGEIDELAPFGAPLSDQQILAHETAAVSGTFGQILQADKSGRFPRSKLEIAWSSNPTARCFIFDDVTDDLRADAGISIQSCNRNFELDRMQAGTMSFALSNRNRRYDDTYTGSLYYPNIKPTRPVRFRCQVATDGPVYSRFFGETEGHPLQRPAQGSDAVASFTAIDMFAALSQDKVGETLVRETEFPGARIEAVLSQVDGLDYSIEEGKHLIIGDDLEGLGRLEHCQAVAESDGGVLFADGRGRIVYQDGHHRALFEATLEATYADGISSESTMKFRFMEPLTDQSRLFTAAAVTPASGVAQRVVSATGVANHRERTKELTVLLADDNAALAMANYYAQRYSTARSRVPNLLLQPFRDPIVATAQAYWTAVLGHEISSRIRTVERPRIEGVAQASWTAVTRDHFIEGISERISQSSWEVSFSVSPAELDSGYFIIGTTQIGDTDELIGW